LWALQDHCGGTAETTQGFSHEENLLRRDLKMATKKKAAKKKKKK
jgi:hypothetical protein